jgi:arginine-tRNA-protein transferase
VLVNFYYNPFIAPKRLDRYLSHGWFRNSNLLGKYKLLFLDDKLCSVVNIRVPLDNYQYSKSLQKIINRNNELFRYEIQPVAITPRKEELYQQHKHRFKGVVLPSLQMSLFGFESCMQSPFLSYEVNIYEGNKLIACSFFDIGEQSIASILGLYDNDYQKYSLGIYTMLLEIEFGLKANKKFYYPGYVLNNSPLFDYKLRMGNIQFHNGKNHWLPYQEYTPTQWADTELLQQYWYLSDQLQVRQIPFQWFYNPYFSLAYVIDDNIFVRSPIVLACFQNPSLYIEYDLDQNCYRVSLLTTALEHPFVEENRQWLGEYKYPNFWQDVHEYQEQLLVTNSVQEVFELVKSY